MPPPDKSNELVCAEFTITIKIGTRTDRPQTTAEKNQRVEQIPRKKKM